MTAYQELGYKHTWMAMITDPTMEWAKHFDDDHAEAQCKVQICGEFEKGNACSG